MMPHLIDTQTRESQILATRSGYQSKKGIIWTRAAAALAIWSPMAIWNPVAIRNATAHYEVEDMGLEPQREVDSETPT